MANAIFVSHFESEETRNASTARTRSTKIDTIETHVLSRGTIASGLATPDNTTPPHLLPPLLADALAMQASVPVNSALDLLIIRQLALGRDVKDAVENARSIMGMAGRLQVGGDEDDDGDDDDEGEDDGEEDGVSKWKS